MEDRVPALVRSSAAQPTQIVPISEDLTKIKQAWLNERGAPEILPFEKEVFERIKQQIGIQVEYLNMLSIALNVKVQEGNVQLSNDQKDRLKAHIFWMEVNRFKYILAAYSRARLEKVGAGIVIVGCCLTLLCLR